MPMAETFLQNAGMRDFAAEEWDRLCARDPSALAVAEINIETARKTCVPERLGLAAPDVICRGANIAADFSRRSDARQHACGQKGRSHRFF